MSTVDPIQPALAPTTPQPPASQHPEVRTKRIAAGVCGILLGSLGVHKFVTGRYGAGIIMLLCTLVGGPFTMWMLPVLMHIIGAIEGVLYLVRSDDEFWVTLVEKRDWF